MLSGIYKPHMLSDVMLNVVMLNVVELSYKNLLLVFSKLLLISSGVPYPLKINLNNHDLTLGKDAKMLNDHLGLGSFF